MKRVVIVVRRGMVQEVYAEEELNVEVLDMDVLDETLFSRRQDDLKKIREEMTNVY